MRSTPRSTYNPLGLAVLVVSVAAAIVVVAGGLRMAGVLRPLAAPAALAAQPRLDVLPPWPFEHPALAPQPDAIPPASPGAFYAPSAAAPLPTPSPTATATAVPTATPAPTEVPTGAPLPLSVLQPDLPAVRLAGLRHEWQTWNNCGPATLAMNLSYYGSPLGQADIGAVLRLDPDDKNVSPHELAAYARSQGYAAQVRVNGSTELARRFLSNGIPLLIETWLEEQPNDGLGHYRLLAGYDDAAQHWIGYDSYVHTNLVSQDPADYQGIALPYAATDALWKVFQRAYVLIYPPDREPVVAAILGESYDPAAMWQQALLAAQAAAAANPGDPFAHFNVGTSLVKLGDYAGAAAAFDQARAIGLPWRMFWYQFDIFEAYAQTGRYQEMVQLADTVNAGAASIEEIHYWRGRGLTGLGDPAAAQAAYDRALQLNPTFAPALDALALR